MVGSIKTNKEIKEQFISACKSFGTLENHVMIMSCVSKHGVAELIKSSGIVTLKTPADRFSHQSEITVYWPTKVFFNEKHQTFHADAEHGRAYLFKNYPVVEAELSM